MNTPQITLTGWVATEPRHVVGPTGSRLTSFRLASTSRHLNRDTNMWEDGATLWVTIRVFRAASLTVRDSVKKGQPVIVAGDLKTRDWDSDTGPRTDVIIDATCVGHDLTKGTAVFTRNSTGEIIQEDQSADADTTDAEHVDA